ncbi:methyltransferase domain-containing protein [Streptomyces sp. NPDC049555]|uniref:SAM-dependent methyltransferase n=1 Tax=unclassified Streptomyces TaxID=2593676 RepID=UPI00344658A6
MTSDSQQVSRLAELAADRVTRDANFVELVATYYGLVNDIYCAGWGESHHFPPFNGEATLQEAQRAVERRLADRAGLRPDMTALDVGSGVGGPARTIAAHSGAHVTGLDLSALRVRQAREKAGEAGLAERTTFVEGDARNMPFPASTFDVAYSFQAICHVPDKTRVHTEIARVLKPGGVSLGYDWLAREGLSAEETNRFIEPICRYHGLSHLSSPRELTDQLRTAGFTGVRVSNAAGEGDLEPVWKILDEVNAMAGSEEITPLLRFMLRGTLALCEAARAGHFLIGVWEARKPTALPERR